MEWSGDACGVCVPGLSFLFRGADEMAKSCLRLEWNPPLESLQFGPLSSSLPFSLAVLATFSVVLLLLLSHYIWSFLAILLRLPA